MTTQAATLQNSRPHATSAYVWLVSALVIGSIWALAGIQLVYGALALAVIIIFAAVAEKYSTQLLVSSLWALALFPFSLGIESGVMPKLFADEILLLLYLIVLLPLCWATGRVWQKGARDLYFVMICFAACQAISLLVRTDLIATRNLLETYILGPMLLVVFLQEAANSDRDEMFANGLIWLTVVIALLSVVERVVQRNPILEQMELGGFVYLSPQIVAITEGVYRPYVTFFHPSETGTFMAMGIPFVFRAWRHKRTWLSAVQLIVVMAGMGVNATRGVWAALAVGFLLLAKRPLKILSYGIPMGSLGGLGAYALLRSTPFMQRLTDLNNLLGRFIYWQLGAEVFADHVALGVGHMQFQNVYLDYIQDLSELAQINLKQIYVIDNIYLTTLVEHGVVGLVGMLCLFVFVATMLKRLHRKLVELELPQKASLIQAGQLVLVIYAVSGFFADVSQFTKATKLFFILIGFCCGAALRSIIRAEGNPDGKEIGGESMVVRPVI